MRRLPSLVIALAMNFALGGLDSSQRLGMLVRELRQPFQLRVLPVRRDRRMHGSWNLPAEQGLREPPGCAGR